MLKKCLSLFVMVIFLSTQSFAITNQNASFESMDVSGQTAQSFEAILAQKENLEKMDQEIEEKINSEDALTSKKLSHRSERKRLKWVKRLSTLSNHSIKMFNKKIDKMDSAQFAQTLSKTSPEILKSLEAKSEVEQRELVKTANENLILSHIPELAQSIVTHGGVVPYMLHLKKNSEHKTNRLPAKIDPCVKYEVAFSALFVTMIVLSAIFIPSFWILMGATMGLPLFGEIFISIALYRTVSPRSCWDN